MVCIKASSWIQVQINIWIIGWSDSWRIFSKSQRRCLSDIKVGEWSGAITREYFGERVVEEVGVRVGEYVGEIFG